MKQINKWSWAILIVIGLLMLCCSCHTRKHIIETSIDNTTISKADSTSSSFNHSEISNFSMVDSSKVEVEESIIETFDPAISGGLVSREFRKSIRHNTNVSTTATDTISIAKDSIRTSAYSDIREKEKGKDVERKAPSFPSVLLLIAVFGIVGLMLYIYFSNR